MYINLCLSSLYLTAGANLKYFLHQLEHGAFLRSSNMQQKEEKELRSHNTRKGQEIKARAGR